MLAANTLVSTAPPRDLVEETKRFLAMHAVDRPSLDEVARAVNVSPFHLHRVFRETTGTTIRVYLEQLRLRTGLERVLDGEDDLAGLAHELGFSSHSHFTDRFHRSFGRTPSEVRASA